MASAAGFGLMIWDGKSPGTVLNVLRLLRSGKIAVLANLPAEKAIHFKSMNDWDNFLTTCDQDLLIDLKSRATPEEWAEPTAVRSALFDHNTGEPAHTSS